MKNMLGKNKISNQKLLFFLGLIILVLVIVPTIRNINQRQKIDEEIKNLEKEISEVKNKNNDLRQIVDYLESDQFLEEKARLDFGLKKKGENVAIIKTGEQDQMKSKEIFSLPPEKNANKPIPNPARWWKYFFN